MYTDDNRRTGGAKFHRILAACDAILLSGAAVLFFSSGWVHSDARYDEPEITDPPVEEIHDPTPPAAPAPTLVPEHIYFIPEIPEPPVETEPAEFVPTYDTCIDRAALDYYSDEVVLAKTAYGEARGCSTTQQAAVMWCVLNRVDNPIFPNTVYNVAAAEGQFHGYDGGHPITEELLLLARDVLARWHAEHRGVENVGRVLPQEFIYFYGDGLLNHFQSVERGTELWDWSMPSPYEEETANGNDLR